MPANDQLNALLNDYHTITHRRIQFAHRVEMTTTSSALLGKHFDVIRFHTIVHRGNPARIWRHQSSQTRTSRTPSIDCPYIFWISYNLKTRQSHPNSLHASYGRNDIIIHKIPLINSKILHIQVPILAHLALLAHLGTLAQIIQTSNHHPDPIPSSIKFN